MYMYTHAEAEECGYFSQETMSFYADAMACQEHQVSPFFFSESKNWYIYVT